MTKETIEQIKEIFKQESNLTTKDIVEYALRSKYSDTLNEPYLWYCDYYYLPQEKEYIEPFPYHVCRYDEKGTHRVFIGVESLKLIDLTKEAALLFEQVNDVVVLEEYNNPINKGLRTKEVDEYRENYFRELLGKDKVKVKD